MRFLLQGFDNRIKIWNWVLDVSIIGSYHLVLSIFDALNLHCAIFNTIRYKKPVKNSQFSYFFIFQLQGLN